MTEETPQEEDQVRNGPEVVERDDGTVLLYLGCPIEYKLKKRGEAKPTEATVETIVFRKPVGADFRAMDGKDGFSAVIAMGAKISDAPEMVFDRLEADDFVEAAAIINRFTYPSRGTGETSSESSS